MLSSPAPHQLIRARYELDNRELARLLRNPYEQHRTLWKLFPDTAKRAFLFRQNTDPALQRRGLGEFLLLAERKPGNDPRFVFAVKAYQPELSVNDALHFTLRAEVLASTAPQAQGNTNKHRRGRRIDPLQQALNQVKPGQQRAALRRNWLYGDSDAKTPALLLKDWLAPKLARLGLGLDVARSRSEAYERVKLNAAEREIVYSVADFQGLVRVLDTSLATQAALHGVGHGKAFGCGLLLLRRARDD